MSLRIAIIGNSHAGAPYLAWRAVESHYAGAARIDFFIERRMAQDPLVIRSPAGETTLPSLLIADRNVLDVEAYDAFFVCGMEVGIATTTAIYRDHRTAGQRSTDREHLVSPAAVHAACLGMLVDSKAAKVVRALRRHTARPVHVLAQPRLTAHVLLAPPDVQAAYRLPIANGDESSVEGFFLEAATRLCATLGAEFLDQPAPTRQGPMLTGGKFGRGQPDDNGPGSFFAMGDFAHMNTPYGLEVINQVLARMGCAVKDLTVPADRPRVLPKPATSAGYTFHPRDEFGITAGTCRLVVYDERQESFCFQKEIDSGSPFLLTFADLPAGFEGKFKIQVMEAGKWSDKVPYRRLSKLVRRRPATNG